MNYTPQTNGRIYCMADSESSVHNGTVGILLEVKNETFYPV